MISSMSSQETTEKIKEMVSLWKYYDRAYFWSPAPSSASRRKAEENNTFERRFNFDGHEFVMSVSMSQSGKNVYVSRELIRDGVRVTIRALTKYIKN